MKATLHAMLAVLLSSLLAVVLFELGLALFYFGQGGHPPRELALMSFYGEPDSVLDGVRIHHQGFTGDAVDHPKPPHTLRVLTLGGSVLFNLNISTRLKQSLNTTLGQPVELLGGALRSHNSASNLVKYREYLSQFEFDVVLVYEGINDLWANHVDPADFRMDYRHLLSQHNRHPLLRHCYSCRVFYELFVYQSPAEKPHAAAWASEQALEQHLRELVALVRVHGATPVLMTFAWYLPPDYSDEAFRRGEAGYSPVVLAGGDYWPVSTWGTPEYVREGLQRHNAVVRRVAAETGTRLIDLETALNDPDRQPQWFGDVCHLTESGVEAFVQAISTAWAQHPPVK